LSRPWLLVALVAAPLPALAMGVVVMRSAGLSTSLWSQNVVAAVLGALLCVAVAAPRHRRPASTATPWLVVVGTAALAATFASPAIEGVHRWVGVGSFRLHVAATLLPAMLAVLYDAGCGRRTAVYGPIMVSVVLFAQPDAAQASAFAVAWAIIAATRRRAGETSGAVVVLVLGAATLFRSDPLGPVPCVEGIVGLAQIQGTGRAVTGGLSLLLLPLPFMLDASQRWLGAGLAAYVLCTVLAASVGNHPVPVMGYGAAPILGYYLGATEFVRGSRDRRGDFA
jgi:cell division protein FtsW (lipid II flippase)